MNFSEVFNDEVFAKDKDQLVEERDFVLNFLVDDNAVVYDLPIYDEYDDDYDVDCLEQPTTLENNSF